MQPEIEAAFLDINKDALRKKIKEQGGKLILEETLMRRVVFDTGKPNSFARVRDEGDKITMTYKNVGDLTLSGTKEICFNVDNYDKAIAFIEALGLKGKANQETLRENWELNDVEISIDTWPWLPTFVELEGPTEEAVKNVAEKLDLDMKDAHYGSVDETYKQYYDIENDDINSCPEIKFKPIPEWLQQKRREIPLHKI
ncbi:MAG: class IV adenylate cyclase [Candidatus Saccharibacteria bacterium]|nr:class IV adenylate cyclase [Candidatus Saccharibacteria bacterium]